MPYSSLRYHPRSLTRHTPLVGDRTALQTDSHNTTQTPNNSTLSGLVVTVVAGSITAVFVMLAVGWLFDRLEAMIPSIAAEYQNHAVFRTWPGWTEFYMRIHPCWFGFVFSVVYILATPSRSIIGRRSAVIHGACYGLLVFSIGSLPVFALIYASFQVSLRLMLISWVARNLAQYVIAGAFLGLVIQRWRNPKLESQA